MLVAFVRERGASLGAVVLVLGLIAVLQASVTYSVTYGPLHSMLPTSVRPGSLAALIQFVLLLVMCALWLRRKKDALMHCIMLSNGLFTLLLLLQTYSLGRILTGVSHNTIDDLLLDVALIASINILIFSIWYWVIDPPGVDDNPHDDQPWDFLFPQRGSNIPHYQSWIPHYADYLFLAYTASFAFSPTDVMPLTKRAKMLMMLQATISIVTLTGLAGSAINILASSS